MRQFEDCNLNDILSFFHRLYKWREDGHTYDTQKSTESICDCLITLTEKCITIEKDVKEIKNGKTNQN